MRASWSVEGWSLSFSASRVNRKPEQRRDDRRDHARREHQVPAAFGRQRRDDERADDPAQVPAGIEGGGSRHGVARGEPHRDAGREVAVGDVARAFDRGVRQRPVAERARGQRGERVGNEFLDQVFQGAPVSGIVAG